MAVVCGDETVAWASAREDTPSVIRLAFARTHNVCVSVHELRGRVGHFRGHLISVFMFVAWLVAARGWLVLLAPIWLAYPAWIAYRLARPKDGSRQPRR